MEPIIEDSIAESFKDEFIYYWEELGLTGKELLEKLHSIGLPELKLYHIYYFARKFKLQKRNKRKML